MRQRWGTRLCYAAAMVIMACGAPRGDRVGPPQVPTRHFAPEWETLQAGARPAAFRVVEPREEYPWLYDGGWRVMHAEDEPAILDVPEALTTPTEPLTFLQYEGETFGATGSLPTHYRLQLQARSLGGAARFNGFGEVAVQLAYHSPIRYLELLQTDQALMIWQAMDAAPMQGSGWKLLAQLPRSMPVGQWFSLDAEVDRASGSIVARVPGGGTLRATSSLLASPAGLTLRATGNREQYRRLALDELP